jgi:cytochrome b561
MKASKYTVTARAIHWATALLIVGALVLAWTIDDLPLSPRKLRLINYHKWAGLSVLWLLVLRAGWRMTHRPPDLPATMTALQQRLAGAAHLLLYLLLATVPMLGWALSSAKGFPVVYLGVVPLPDLLPKDKAAADLLHAVHETAAWTLVVLAAGHAAAALKHHFVDRDDVLRRML